MNDELKAKLFEIRCRSKRGQQLMQKELDFCRAMYERHPEEYSAMSAEIFEATRPAGSVR